MRSKQIGTMLAVASVAAAIGVAGGIAGGSAATGGNGSGDPKAGDKAPPGRHVGPNGQRERPSAATWRTRSAPRRWRRSTEARSNVSRRTPTTARPTRRTCGDQTGRSSRYS